jgi:hypothetical protein
MSRHSRTDVTPYRQAGSCLALGKTSSRSSGESCSRPRPCSFNPAATKRSHDARLGRRIDGHVGQSRPSRQTQVGAARPSAPRRSGRRGYRAKKSSRLMDDTESCAAATGSCRSISMFRVVRRPPRHCSMACSCCRRRFAAPVPSSASTGGRCPRNWWNLQLNVALKNSVDDQHFSRAAAERSMWWVFAFAKVQANDARSK